MKCPAAYIVLIHNGSKMHDGSKCFRDTSSTSLPDQDKLLQDAHRRKLIEYIPLIVVLCIIAVIGIIGNILTIAYYGFRVNRTPTFVLIKLLAIVDLIVCLLCFTTIADLCVNIKFTSAILCKTMYFLDHWSMQLSVLILWIISIHRYRRICRPVGWQLTVKSAIVAVVVASVFSMIYCTHIFITYNPVKVNVSTLDVAIPTVAGHYCTNTDDPGLKDFLISFDVSDVVLVTLCFITFLITYGNIWRTVRKHNKIAAASNRPDQTLATTAAEAKIVCKIQTSSKSSTIVTRERNITVVMFVVNVGLVICFTPYFVASLGIRAMSATTEDELNTGMELALRFPFFNSVINPIIFCLFNSRYRRYVKEKFTLCRQCLIFLFKK